MKKFGPGVLILATMCLPVSGKSHKVSYPNACAEVWAAVKQSLGNEENYKIGVVDQSRMTATYSVKHKAHATLTGALRQRANTVALSAQGPGCEMEVKSSYSGFEHNDAGDFAKRVSEALARKKDEAHPVAVK